MFMTPNLFNSGNNRKGQWYPGPSTTPMWTSLVYLSLQNCFNGAGEKAQWLGELEEPSWGPEFESQSPSWNPSSIEKHRQEDCCGLLLSTLAEKTWVSDSGREPASKEQVECDRGGYTRPSSRLHVHARISYKVIQGSLIEIKLVVLELELRVAHIFSNPLYYFISFLIVGDGEASQGGTWARAFCLLEFCGDSG